ncbi:MAG: thioredoxin domain-containing protein [Ilumatobacteraceae bacterium]
MTNRLAAETSPYLRQHADNPVDWYPWGPEAFAAATDRNVPILLSVGYSACHWCHVMGHECFEDAEVSETMNRLFVNIKVDREERPDVDSVYMEAVQAMTGRGGWPMTVFITPDGKPFYGGTYFPKPQFVQLMAAIDDVWRNKPADVQQNTAALMKSLNAAASLAPDPAIPGLQQVDTALQQLARAFDSGWGGFGNAPKFPSSMNLDLILRAYARRPSTDARTVITTSLDAMASGGMYDHIGGGFARYSVDREWLVPHFEKMLYDQALLVRLYLHAWQVTGAPHWKQVVEETIDYVLREMTHPLGGFYSAEDADSPDEQGHGHEGLFYTWTPNEMIEVLGPELGARAIEWWEVTADGNFDGRSILCRLNHRGELIRPAHIETARAQLYDARAQRRRPGLDDKVITEWNALFLSSLAEAAAAMQRDDWMQAALRAGQFLIGELRSTVGRWSRSWQADGAPPARHSALAADHATLVDAFTRLGEASGQARWIAEAVAVADTLLDHFWDHDNGGVFTTADDGEALIVRQKELVDNATPSANSVLAVALYRLAALTGEMRFANHADRTLQLLGSVMLKAPTAVGNAMAAIDIRETGLSEILITGDRPDLLAEVRGRWLPNAVVAWGEPFDSPLWDERADGFAYVCRQFVCQLPVSTAADLASLLTTS